MAAWALLLRLALLLAAALMGRGYGMWGLMMTTVGGRLLGGWL